jgi:uncharacterized protein YhfF
VAYYWRQIMLETWNEVDIAGLERTGFGDGSDLSDQLLALVLSGKKTATCWAAREGQQTIVGKRMVACDWLGRPQAVLETIALTQCMFSQVTEDFARKEGEGDLSSHWWRDTHAAYFARNGGFSQDMLLWCEEFVLVASAPT